MQEPHEKAMVVAIESPPSRADERLVTGENLNRRERRALASTNRAIAKVDRRIAEIESRGKR